MSDALVSRLETLGRSLRSRLRAWDLRVTPYREGVDCWVDLVELPHGAWAVVRSAKMERQLTRYEGLVDFGVELVKQVAVAGLLRDHGIPTPEVLAWHVTADPANEPSWMLLERMEESPTDWSDPGLYRQLGILARRIHDISPCVEVGSALAQTAPWEPWVVDRIACRVAAAGAYMAVPLDRDVRRALAARLRGRGSAAGALLHLDLRPPNIAVRDGQIVSLFDLGNAIVGDPLLELARIRGCGLLSHAFLSGYGSGPAELTAYDATLDVYELDLTALLVVVSREEFNDPALHATMRGRTQDLLHRLLRSAA